MPRVPKTKTRDKKRALAEQVFQAAPGTRRLAGGMCALLAVMFLIHQTQVDGIKPFIRLFAMACTGVFTALAFYFFRRGNRRGPVLRIGPDGFGIAIGFDGWVDLTWDQVKAFKYWEPTGITMLVKRRQSRWVGVAVKDPGVLADRPASQRFEMGLNTFHNRPPLCVLHPFVDADILDVLQAFKDHAPPELDDYKGEIIP